MFKSLPVKEHQSTNPINTLTEKWYFLLPNEVDIDAKDDKGLTLLHKAAKSNQSEVIQALNEADANLHITNKVGYPPPTQGCKPRP